MFRSRFFSRLAGLGLAFALFLGSAPLAAQEAGSPAVPEPATPTAPDDDSSLPSFFATTTVTAVGREVDTFEVATPVTVIPALEIERR